MASILKITGVRRDMLKLSFISSIVYLYIIFGDPFSQIWASEMIFSGRFKSKQRVET